MRTRARLTTALALGVLSLNLTACGASQEGPSGSSRAATSEKPEQPEPSEQPEYDTTYNEVTPTIDPAAVTEFGPDGAAQGTDAAVDFSMEYAFDQTLITAPIGGREDAALAMTTSMTPTAAHDWAAAIKEYNSGPKGRQSAGGLVMGLTLYQAWSAHENGKGATAFQPEGPAAVNPQLRSVKTVLDPDGRLKVEIQSSADVRLLVSGKPKQMKITRDQTFWMTKTADDWTIDGWTGRLKAGQYRPDK
jgi:hypothetical protein